MRGSGSYDWCILYCGEIGEREKGGREGGCSGWGVKEREREREKEVFRILFGRLDLIKFYVATTCAHSVSEYYYYAHTCLRTLHRRAWLRLKLMRMKLISSRTQSPSWSSTPARQ